MILLVYRGNIGFWHIKRTLKVFKNVRVVLLITCSRLQWKVFKLSIQTHF